MAPPSLLFRCNRERRFFRTHAKSKTSAKRQRHVRVSEISGINKRYRTTPESGLDAEA